MFVKKIRKDFTNLRKNFKTLGRIFSYMFSYKFQISVIFITTIISSLAGIVGTAFLKIVIDKYIEPLTKNYDKLLISGFIDILLIMACIYLLGAFCSYLSGRLTVNVVAKTLYKIRIDLFIKMEKSSIKYFDSHKHGELMSLYTNDINVLGEMLSQTFTGYISPILTIIGAFSIMFYYSRQLTLLVISIVLMVLFCAKKIVKKSNKYFTDQQDELAKLNGFVEEMVEGQKVVKVFCHEKQTRNDFKKINTDLCRVSTKAIIYAVILFPLSINILNLNYILVAVVGSIFVAKSVISMGILIPFLIYTRDIVDPIVDLTEQMSNVFPALAGARRVFMAIDGEDEIDEGTINIELKNNDLFFVGKNIRKRVEGNIKFENVIFNYGNKKQVLKSINLEVNRGEKIALVGSTGAGKTTIISVLNRFYDIQGGKITFDDIDIKTVKKSDFRKLFSIVLQDTHLFTGTIMENIKYGKLDASNDEVMIATKLANVDKFVSRLPNGYDTVLKADASNLSQGERQLLSIARAILSNREVLILDEATSSIDIRTESLIEEAIDNLVKNKTVFIIAHRLSTVKNADKIVVLENGKVVEQGNHEELLKSNGRYYELYSGLVSIE